MVKDIWLTRPLLRSCFIRAASVPLHWNRSIELVQASVSINQSKIPHWSPSIQGFSFFVRDTDANRILGSYKIVWQVFWGREMNGFRSRTLYSWYLILDNRRRRTAPTFSIRLVILSMMAFGKLLSFEQLTGLLWNYLSTFGLGLLWCWPEQSENLVIY